VSKLSGLAEDYWQKMSPQDQKLEKDAFDAGADIRNENCTRKNLESIVHWKSARTVPLLEHNDDAAIQKALEIASDTNTPVKEALSELIKLIGVGIPVASAILTAIHPDRYTVIDFRALETLGHSLHDEDFYVAYLDFCRNLAVQHGVKEQKDYPAPTPLRALDRALWQWSKKKGSND
jgi:hypothetical protein